MSNRAWVTLATNDSYGLGALVLAHSLRRVGSTHSTVVLITPSVTDAMRDRLHAVFTEVVTVDVLDSRDAAHLALLQRPELGITFTKIHCWELTQYEKCVFLDADTLVVQNCDELFEREELSAAPDVGWPDCFNSGVFVYKPSTETFDALIKFAQERGSFDGGDQGLLNSFFSDWARGDINRHLPFLYNVTSAAFYSYLPALKHYGQDLKIIHFIGVAKPWLQPYNWESSSVDAPDHIKGLLQLWWDIFVGQVHHRLDSSMSGVAGNLARVVPGAVAREAVDELARRQGWEAGNIDYMGADSFDNIWAKISQTLNQPRQSPPKQSPPKETKQPSPPKEAAPKQPSPPKETAPKQPSPPKETAPKQASPSPPKEADAKPAEVPVEAKPAEVPVEAKPEKTPQAKPAEVPADAKPAEKPGEEPAGKPTPVSPAVEAPAPTETPAPAPAGAPAPVKTPVPATEAPVVAAAEAPVVAAAEAPKAEIEKTDKPEVPPTPPATPKSTPEPSTPVAEVPVPAVVEALLQASSPATALDAPASPAAPQAAATPTPEKTLDVTTTSSDSPPLANTPSKEEAPADPAKSTEEAAQETRL